MGEEGRTRLEMGTGEGEGIERIPQNAHREHPAGWELACAACHGKERVREYDVVCAFGTSWINKALDTVSDEERAGRGVMRGNELVRNSTCALILDG